MKKITLFTLGLSLVLAGCGNIKTSQATTSASSTNTNNSYTGNNDAFSASQISVDSTTGQEYVNNQVVVSLGQENAQELADRLKARIIDKIPQLNVVVLELDSANSAAVAERLQIEGKIRYAQPNLVYKNSQPTEKKLLDERLGQSAVRNIFDQLPQYALDSNHMGAEFAWMNGVRGRGVTVAVIDDPVDVSHPDLSANWGGKAYDPRRNKTYTTAQSWIDNIDSMGRYPQPVDNVVDRSIAHGTAVASTISAARNGIGVTGIAPDSKYIAAAIFTPNSVGSANIAKAVLWSADNGANILNNSWGGPGYDQLTKDAFDYALERNITVVVSSGNSYRKEHSRPAFYPGVIAVGALSVDNSKAPFSTYGRHLSVSAPGVDIVMASPMYYNSDGTRKSGSTPADGTGYTLMSGTSFSGPYTAGAAALILGERPELDPYQVRRLLETTADGRIGSNPNGYDVETGWGAVRADRLAGVLKTFSRMPVKGGNLIVKVEVKMPDGSYLPANRASDIIINLPENGDATKGSIFGARTNAQGEARFLQIAPGEYTVRVGTPDSLLNNGAERGTLVTKAVVTSSTPSNPTVLTVKLDKGYVAPPEDKNTDPYEINDSIETATPLKLGERPKGAMIYNNVCNSEKPDECDVDFYKFTAEAGKSYTLNLFDRFHPTEKQGRLSGVAYVRDSAGKKLRDSTGRLVMTSLVDNKVVFTAPTKGEYYIQVGGFSHLLATVGERPYKGVVTNSIENTYSIELNETK